jgi:hypothetical protein
MEIKQTTAAKKPRVDTTSQVVRDLPESISQPEQNISCLKCPNAVWRQHAQESLSCYCRVDFTITWHTKTKGNIVNCDGLHIGKD